jgi:two-component system chemotaxis response regulator CheY
MPTVLLVDDAELVRVNLRKMLNKYGFEVIGEAEDGYMAVKRYQRLRPDLVTTDITMPGMGGITAIEKIREVDPDAKIVVISAMGQLPIIRQAIAAGAKSFINKPFTEEQVIQTLQAVWTQS